MRRSRLSVELLRDDDEGYATWLAVNVGGYVLNIQRSLIPSDARIHGAACHTINETLPRGRTWTGSYVKACSFSLPELQAWAPTHARLGSHTLRHLPAIITWSASHLYAIDADAPYRRLFASLGSRGRVS